MSSHGLLCISFNCILSIIVNITRFISAFNFDISKANGTRRLYYILGVYLVLYEPRSHGKG